jgi:hypothetical protein
MPSHEFEENQETAVSSELAALNLGQKHLLFLPLTVLALCTSSHQKFEKLSLPSQWKRPWTPLRAGVTGVWNSVEGFQTAASKYGWELSDLLSLEVALTLKRRLY